jgi:DNA repair exonuclease SbcCD ATPase subunit
MSVSTLSLARYETALSTMRSRYEQGRGQLALLKEQREEKEAALSNVRANIDLWRNVSALLTKVSDYARRQLVERIEETVTAALQTVLADDSLRFEVEIGERNKTATAEWRVVSRYGNTEVSNNPEDARGGGIVDIVSLALRLALLELSRPRPEGPVILDEPAKMVSAEYSENLTFFLKSYAQKTGRQFIVVTHNRVLANAGDVSYFVSKNAQGVSEVIRE